MLHSENFRNHFMHFKGDSSALSESTVEIPKRSQLHNTSRIWVKTHPSEKGHLYISNVSENAANSIKELEDIK
jgi:hypothetical protein